VNANSSGSDKSQMLLPLMVSPDPLFLIYNYRKYRKGICAVVCMDQEIRHYEALIVHYMTWIYWA
jgi:hypothetical protein